MVKLNWTFDNEYKTWETSVKAKDYLGEGYYKITLQPRPHYCDRGRWLLVITSHGVSDLDCQEALSRYYFNIDYAKGEVESWANARDTVKNASNECA